MPCRTPFFGCVLLAVAAVSIALGPARLEAGPAEAAADKSWPTQITTTYKVTFNGFDIGSFRFQSQISPQGYTLDGSAELSALLGAFQWKGVTRSSGTVQGDAPKPAGYTFDFKGNSKTGAVKMSFKDGGVANVSLVPPAKPPSPETVPVKDQHLKDVLDPLSAVMALLRGGVAQPCGRSPSSAVKRSICCCRRAASAASPRRPSASQPRVRVPRALRADRRLQDEQGTKAWRKHRIEVGCVHPGGEPACPTVTVPTIARPARRLAAHRDRDGEPRPDRARALGASRAPLARPGAAASQSVPTFARARAFACKRALDLGWAQCNARAER
jgi:hypothetical protein